MATSGLLSSDFFVCTVKAHTQCICSLMISILECYPGSFQKHICVCCLVWYETGQDVMDSNTRAYGKRVFMGSWYLVFVHVTSVGTMILVQDTCGLIIDMFFRVWYRWRFTSSRNCCCATCSSKASRGKYSYCL